MKKIMSLMLGLTFVLGTCAFAADEKPATTETKQTTKKGKKVEKKEETKKPETK